MNFSNQAKIFTCTGIFFQNPNLSFSLCSILYVVQYKLKLWSSELHAFIDALHSDLKKNSLLKCVAQNFQKYPNADRPQDRPQKIVLQPRNLTQLKCTMCNNRFTVLPCCTPSDGAAYLSCFQTPCEICGVAHSFHCQVVDHGSTSDWSSSSKCKLLSCAIHTVIAHPCIQYQIALEFNGYGQQGIISFKM